MASVCVCGKRRRRDSEQTVQNLEVVSVDFWRHLSHRSFLSSSWLLFPLYSDKFRYIVWLLVFWHSVYLFCDAKCGWLTGPLFRAPRCSSSLSDGRRCSRCSTSGPSETGRPVVAWTWMVTIFCPIRRSLADEDTEADGKTSYCRFFTCLMNVVWSFFFFPSKAKFGLIRRHVFEATLQFPASLICHILSFVPE